MDTQLSKLKIGNTGFDPAGRRVYIMGILNVTPDSFSDGGKFQQIDAALRHVEEMVRDGADIVDIGGESTRPGYVHITEAEEIERVARVVRAVKERFDVPVSVDTYKWRVMDALLAEGADLANDIWGLRYGKFSGEEDHMAEVVAKHGVPVVIMHNDALARSREERTEEQYRISLREESEEEDVILRVKNGLLDSIRIAKASGIAEDKIILDPGVGFAKTQEENLKVIQGLAKITKLDYPVLLAASRKSVIGNVLNLPPEEREEGTIVTSVMAAMAGCRFVRVHDVAANRRALDMAETIMQSGTGLM
ncbi:MAG: dihydropteroate synthase [Lachnospiraceae bacterium]|nr:dihydropteroate synthase [Lachnospiraceae bacterium]